MIPTLDSLLTSGYLSHLDYHFALTAGRIAGEENSLVHLAAAVTSRFTNLGHVCVNFDALAGKGVELTEGEPLAGLTWPEAKPWREAVEASPMVTMDQQSPAPLVLTEKGDLYLYRYWDYQNRLAHQLRLRAAQTMTDLDQTTLQNGLDRLFLPTKAHGANREQRRAAHMAMNNGLSIVSGGPGTGKTSVVVRILALLMEQADVLERKSPVVALLAPTGKAAARLSESIQNAKVTTGAMALNCSGEHIAAIPDQASTIHRALGSRFDTPTEFRHHAENPLLADVVIVDEASMIDLALMTKLLEAVKPTARLVLLGDKDQLTSIGAGAILGDIYHAFSSRSARYQHCMVHFTRTYRFETASTIGMLAQAINRGDADTALDLMNDPKAEDVKLIAMADSVTKAGLQRAIEPLVSDFFQPFDHRKPEAALAVQGGHRILCAHRRGLAGVETINRLTESILRQGGVIYPGTDWYAGRPILINQNDYQVELFNGDVGILGTVEASSGDLRAFFAKPGGGIRRIAPSRLPSHETVYAMTVHKSQGSEFDRVLLILPERPSPILTRELLYTAVTRAKRKLTLLANEKIIRTAIETRAKRSSGLVHQLK